MPLIRDRTSAGLASGALLITALLSACGGAQVESSASEVAYQSLIKNLGTAVTCLENSASDLAGVQTDADIIEAISDCAGTTFFNHDDEAISSTDQLSSKSGTIAVSGKLSSGSLTLNLTTSGAGLAEAGVSRARALSATCWQVTIDLESGALGSPRGTGCNDAVLTRENPSEVVPFAKVEREVDGVE